MEVHGTRNTYSSILPKPCMVMHYNSSLRGYCVLPIHFIVGNTEAHPGGLGEQPRGKMHLFRGNKGQILRGTKTILGNM